MKKNLIIFDCFGVIFKEIAPVLFEKYLSSDEADRIKDEIFIPADLGQITYDEIFVRMSAVLGFPEDRVKKEWNELIILNEDIIPVIRRLGEDNDVALLSNAPYGFVEGLFEKYSLTELFDKIFISCNMGLAKPDREIYKKCVSAFGGNYEKIFMIDDNKKNLEPLSEIGIVPVHYKGIESLEELYL